MLKREEVTETFASGSGGPATTEPTTQKGVLGEQGVLRKLPTLHEKLDIQGTCLWLFKPGKPMRWVHKGDGRLVKV